MDDDYEFDISQDLDYDNSNGKYGSTKSVNHRQKQSVVTSSMRRSSIQDRTQQILERNKTVGKSSILGENTERLSSYKSTLADLLEGITIPNNVSTTSNTGRRRESEVYRAPQTKKRTDSQQGLPGDSFDISMTDLEARMMMNDASSLNLLKKTYLGWRFSIQTRTREVFGS